VDKLTYLRGLAEGAVIAKLGVSTYSNTFTLRQGKGLPEFYVEIHNTYPAEDPKSEGVEIRELRWERTGYTEVVFLHKVDGEWRVLESGRGKDGVVF